MMNVKKLCFLSMLTVIILVQELALSFIPNIQLTFLLLAIYASVLGLKNTFLIITVQVLLDNLIMGSFIPIVIIPMLLGYYLIALLTYIVKNGNIFIISLFAGIGAIIYALLFVLTNFMFLDIRIKDYIIADIPFTLILVACTIITILFLYEPIKKIINNEWININSREDIE